MFTHQNVSPPQYSMSKSRERKQLACKVAVTWRNSSCNLQHNWIVVNKSITRQLADYMLRDTIYLAMLQIVED